MVDDASRLGNLMRKRLTAALEAGRSQARKEAEIIANIMRATAPRDEMELIRSIRVEDAATRKTTKHGEVGFVGVVVKAGDETTIVTNARGQRFQNAKLQEHGTKKMKANPYFNSSYRRRRSQAKASITRAVKKAWVNG